MPLLQIPTTQFSTSIRELNLNKVIFDPGVGWSRDSQDLGFF